MNFEKDLWVKQEQFKDLLREADKERLVHQVKASQVSRKAKAPVESKLEAKPALQVWFKKQPQV